MTGAELRARCLQKPGASEYLPFGPSPVCFRVGGRIFAQLYAEKVTLKCEPMRADHYRQRFPGVVARGCHCPPAQQPYWNTLPLDGVDDETMGEMLDHAYAYTVSRLTRRKRAALEVEACP